MDRNKQQPQNPYIPVTIFEGSRRFPYIFDKLPTHRINGDKIVDGNKERTKRDDVAAAAAATSTTTTTTTEKPKASERQMPNIFVADRFSKDRPNDQQGWQKPKKKLPYFHVTYWMFYPYSQVSFSACAALLKQHLINMFIRRGKRYVQLVWVHWADYQYRCCSACAWERNEILAVMSATGSI